MNNRKVIDKIKQGLEKDDIRTVARKNKFARDLSYDDAVELSTLR